MKSKTAKRKSLTIVASTAMTLFSLFVLFVATVAWFAANREVGGGGLEITIAKQEETVETVAIHRCILNQSTSENLVFNSVCETSTLILPDYSELNKSQPTLLLFVLSGDESSMASNIKITATSTSSNYTTQITDDNYNSFPFSSVIYFRTVAVTSETFPFQSVASNMYSNTTSFVTVTENVFSGFTQEISIFDGSTMQNAPSVPLTYVGVILDYYDEALMYLSSCNTGNEHRLNFSFDFSMSVE